MGSSRLPGKALADVCGKPALTRLYDRLRLSERLDDIILATTTLPSDDVLANWAEDLGIACHRGSADDVTNRLCKAHGNAKSDVVVQVCGDCPLIDATMVDRAISRFLELDCDVVTTSRRFSYPQGVDVQVYSFASLTELDRALTDPVARECVTLHFYEHPEKYRIADLEAPPGERLPEQRCQLDYPEDLTFIREVYARLEPVYGDAFGAREIVDLLRERPSLGDINRHCVERVPRET